jgi:hypothetical protein
VGRKTGQYAWRRGLGLITAPARVLPHFLIIGAQRAGTTSLYYHLVGHPQVRAATSKEVYYFDFHWRRSLWWYRSHFPLAGTTEGGSGSDRRRITGEASPSYLFCPPVAPRVALRLPEVKLIVLLRNPVDRAYSQYWHEIRSGRESCSFREAIAREDERLARERARLGTERCWEGWHHRRHSYLARGRYLEQLRHWWRWVPRQRLLVVQSEALFLRPAVSLARVYRFLGLVPPEEEGFGRYGTCSPYPGLSRQVWAHLTEYFAPHNDALYDELGREFDWD